MFSSGNITEKLRISQFDCSNETVVDLFAGSLMLKSHFLRYVCFYMPCCCVKRDRLFHTSLPCTRSSPSRDRVRVEPDSGECVARKSATEQSLWSLYRPGRRQPTGQSCSSSIDKIDIHLICVFCYGAIMLLGLSEVRRGSSELGINSHFEFELGDCLRRFETRYWRNAARPWKRDVILDNT